MYGTADNVSRFHHVIPFVNRYFKGILTCIRTPVTTGYDLPHNSGLDDLDFGRYIDILPFGLADLNDPQPLSCGSTVINPAAGFCHETGSRKRGPADAVLFQQAGIKDTRSWWSLGSWRWTRWSTVESGRRNFVKTTIPRGGWWSLFS